MADQNRGGSPNPAVTQDRAGRPALRAYIAALGPGIVSGASDNDPTTIATLSVVGATTGYQLSWLTLLLFPMLATIQVISAQVGIVTRQGLQGIVRQRHGACWSLLLLLAILIVNVITIGADLEAGAAALNLLLPIPWRLFVLPYTLVLLAVLLFGTYRVIERLLKYVLLLFVVYIGSAFLAHPQWGAVLHATLVPSLSFSSASIQGALSLLGTTLTGYVYVWQTIAEAEVQRPVSELRLAQVDAGLGMFIAVAVFWFILISTGATLGVHHTAVQTAQDAARALEPLAGRLAGLLFAVGLLASSMLAVPVLAATSAYVVGEHFGWKNGLSRPLREAPRFYAVLAASVLVALGVAYAGIAPIQCCSGPASSAASQLRSASRSSS